MRHLDSALDQSGRHFDCGEPSHKGVVPLQLRLLGGFRAERGDLARPVYGWQRRSAKTLTKLLATHPGHALHREQILEILWPRFDFESALNSFGKALHAARRALEPELLPRKSSAYLQLTDSVLSLSSQHVLIDADRFQQLAEDALRRRDIGGYDCALAAYGGELLPEDRYEDWCAERRSFLAELRIQVLLGLAEALEQRGARRRAADRLRDALGQEPTREEVHRRLMRLDAEMGLRDQALRQFRVCQEVLRRELGLGPQRETVALYEDILADRIPTSSPEQVEERATSQPGRVAVGSRHAAVASPFIGRGAVLARLCDRVTESPQQRPGMVLLSGEAGIGKTRLLEELGTAARQRGAAVLWGGSGAHATRLSCGPFAIALEDYVAGRPDAERDELARRYPALASLVPSLPVKGPLPSGDTGRDDLALAIVRFLVGLARERPVLLVIGDVEHSDPFSLDLLRYLAHLAITRRWLLIGALREEQPENGTGLRRAIDAMTREQVCETVQLHCLSRKDCDTLVRAMLAGNRADDKLHEEIYTRSGGNPLFVGELVREMQERDELVLAGGCWHRSACGSAPVPARVRALVAMQLAEVDETVRRVLSLAAAGAADISLREIRSGAAALDPPVSDPALFAALDRALQMRILEERNSGYVFRQPLVRAALYGDLPRHRRDQLDAAHGRSRSGSSRRLRVAATG